MQPVPPKATPPVDKGLSDAEREALKAEVRAREAARRARLKAEAERPDDDGPEPDVVEALQQLGATSKAGAKAALDATKAFRSLVSADFSLARSALGRTLAFTGVAIAFGASAWLLLMAALIAVLSGPFGMTITGAVLVTAIMSCLVTWFAGWQAMRYFEHTRMQATRRQLARLGIGELADFMPEMDSARSARHSARDEPPAGPDGKPPRDERGVEVTPP
ncbi:phage holin family protein [Marilutibacter spongiae]|uniref:phage holin family protein n=1 Tax=Marilutibacter spongiae TaxID=2025720 RepID=UPI001FE3A230|nr:phage holin family protein [Lysobacter spongiae]